MGAPCKPRHFTSLRPDYPAGWKKNWQVKRADEHETRHVFLPHKRVKERNASRAQRESGWEASSLASVRLSFFPCLLGACSQATSVVLGSTVTCIYCLHCWGQLFQSSNCNIEMKDGSFEVQ